MFEPILQSLRDVEGVQGALIIDPTAAVVAHNAHASYDTGVLQQVARAVVNSVDSIQLVQDDWDMLNAHFGDGQLVLRSLRTTGDKPRRFVLAVIADASLNVAFLGVALRVASGKLVVELESASSSSSIPIAIAGGTGRVPKSDLSVPDRGAFSWSGDTGVVSRVGTGSGAEISVTDPSGQTFLSACTRALASSVGPMAKVFVKEAVRAVCGDRPFAPPDGPALIAHLARLIDDPDDRAAFVRATRTL